MTIAIITGIVFCGALAWFYYNEIKQEKRLKGINCPTPEFDNEEIAIKGSILDVLRKDYPKIHKQCPKIWLVRDVTEHIDILNKSWQNFRTFDPNGVPCEPVNAQKGYGGLYVPLSNIIFINTDGYSNSHFAKVLTHHLLQTQGYVHGAVMDAKVGEVVDKVMDLNPMIFGR